MAVTSNNPTIVRILNALGLENVRSMTISAAVGSVVAVVTEQYVTGNQLERLAGELETKEWVLVPKIKWDIDCGRVGFIASASVEAVAKPRHPLLPPAYAPTALSNRVRPEAK